MSLWNFGTRAKRMPRGKPEWDGQLFDLDDERIPEPIRAAICKHYRAGYTIYFADTKEGGEWWLLDGEELVEAFWTE